MYTSLVFLVAKFPPKKKGEGDKSEDDKSQSEGAASSGVVPGRMSQSTTDDGQLAEPLLSIQDE
jgi:hypothetical protein